MGSWRSGRAPKVMPANPHPDMSKSWGQIDPITVFTKERKYEPLERLAIEAYSEGIWQFFRGLHDRSYRKGIHSTKTPEYHGPWAEQVEYIKSHDVGNPCSFASVCVLLGWDEEVIRESLLAMIPDGTEAKIKRVRPRIVPLCSNGLCEDAAA